MDKQTLSKFASLAGLIIAIGGLYYLLELKCLFADNPAGISIQALSAGLMFWARYTFGMRSFHAVANTTEGGLVTHGPYRWFRHPIYASIIYFIWAGVLSHFSENTVYAGLVITGGMVLRLLLEERFLRVTYPEYADYSKRTKRIIPFIF